MSKKLTTKEIDKDWGSMIKGVEDETILPAKLTPKFGVAMHRARVVVNLTAEEWPKPGVNPAAAALIEMTSSATDASKALIGMIEAAKKVMITKAKKKAKEKPTMVGTYSIETLQKSVDILTKELERRSQWDKHMFKLNGPQQFSTQVDEKWSQKGFIGGEKFVLIGAYVGRRGDAINCTFVAEKNAYNYYLNTNLDKSTKHIRTIEMFDVVAKDCMDGFADFVAKAWQNHNDSVMIETRREVAAMEDAAHEEAKIDPFETNPLFGSW